jgi:hypothetical protein
MLAFAAVAVDPDGSGVWYQRAMAVTREYRRLLAVAVVMVRLR